MKIYTIVHNEIFADIEETYRIDAVVQHMTDTEEKAIAYVKACVCSSYSWWEVFCGEIDVLDVVSIGLFGPRGHKRKGPPLTKQLLKAYRKAKKQDKQHQNGG